MPRVLLIFPPHTRNTEPPIGIALLAADLRAAGVETRLVDLNCIAGPEIARAAPDAADHRTHRAALNIAGALEALRSPSLYRRPAAYRTTVGYYADALRAAARGRPWSITPCDLKDGRFTGFGPEVIERIAADPAASPFFDFFERSLDRVLREFEPDLAGVSIIYRSQFLAGVALAAWLRRARAQEVVLGGGLVGALGGETIAACERLLGRAVVGDGEPAVRSLLGLPPSAGRFCDPEYGDVEFDRYFAPGPVIPIAASRGCYWRNCAFCAETQSPFALDRPAEFRERLERLSGRFCGGRDAGMFHFTDNAVPPAILGELAARGAPGRWYGFVRPEPALADPEFVRALARSGCAMLQLGLETPVPRLIERMRKGVDPSGFGAILRNLRAAGIASYVYLLFGFPGQTVEDCEATVEFLAEHPVDFINASIFRLPPETEVARHPDDYAIARVGERRSNELYRSFEGEGLVLPDLRRWMSGRFYCHEAVRSTASRTPRFYKSNHAVYFGPARRRP